MTTAAPFRIDPRQADQSWLAIVRRHHEAKALARCGKMEQANSLLGDALPPLIRQWGKSSGLPRHLQMLRLRKLLQGDLSALLRPRPKTKRVATQSEATNRIPLSDISKMIDAVHRAEAQVRQPLQLAS